MVESWTAAGKIADRVFELAHVAQQCVIRAADERLGHGAVGSRRNGSEQTDLDKSLLQNLILVESFARGRQRDNGLAVVSDVVRRQCDAFCIHTEDRDDCVQEYFHVQFRLIKSLKFLGAIG
eukprot:COSAG03_NODE_276_length_9556_cov_8.462360_8_plen_122_part_00